MPEQPIHPLREGGGGRPWRQGKRTHATQRVVEFEVTQVNRFDAPNMGRSGVTAEIVACLARIIHEIHPGQNSLCKMKIQNAQAMRRLGARPERSEEVPLGGVVEHFWADYCADCEAFGRAVANNPG